MKRARKKTVSSESERIGTGDTKAGIRTEEVEDSDVFTPTSDSAQDGRFTIDGVRGLQAIAVGLAVIELVWLVLHRIMQVI